MTGFTEISDYLTIMQHDFVQGNCAIVIGADRTMVIDAGAYPAHAAALIDHLRHRGLRCDVFGLTHGHGDHVAGIIEIDPIDGVVAHPGALTRALQAVGNIAASADNDPAGTAQGLASRLGAARLTDSIDLGGVVVEVVPTPGHTSDSICFAVDGVLVGGDTVVTSPPAFADGDSSETIDSLRRLSDREWEGLIPGHGPVLSDRAEVGSWLTNQLGYLEQLRSVTDELMKKLPTQTLVDEVASRVGLPDFQRQTRTSADFATTSRP